MTDELIKEEFHPSEGQILKSDQIKVVDRTPRIVGEIADGEFWGGRWIPDIRRVIRKWDDGYGNTLFIQGDAYLGDAIIGPHRKDKVAVLATQIKEQRDVFSRLSDEDRARIQAEFDSSKVRARSSKPYSDYLQSEALGKRFEELKTFHGKKS